MYRFNRNEIREHVSKLGLSHDVRLTTKEWRLIRRQINKKTRRFSRRFVESQLEELRKYRARVRLIQHNAANFLMASIGFDIPAPIPFGTAVTAYSTKYEIILRGVVLSHEPKKFAYLIRFDRKEFGCEFCVDYNVASHGGPSILVPRDGRRGMVGFSAIGSAKGTLPDKLQLPQTQHRAELQNSVLFDPYPCPTKNGANKHDTDDARLEAVRQVSETESLMGLVAIIDAVTRRKEMLLGALEEAAEVVRTHQNLSHQFTFSCQWLKSNLHLTDQVLEAALPKMRILYGQLYMSAPSM